MANNADWVVDADQHNIGIGTGGAMTVGRGNESNPQQIPTPAQSQITAATAETFWEGALSSWGVAAAKRGLTVETLPYNGRITYGDASNPQDLSHYKVYVVDEPNIAFTAAEKTAILNWVNDGGGLFLISDHNNSDRNNDGIDSPAVLNALLRDNGIAVNPFGFTYDLASFSETSSGYRSLPGNAVLNGPYGAPRQIQISSGTSMTLSTTANATVKALCYRNSGGGGTTNVLVAQALYGQGRVMGMGDSSPMDDGTGDPGDQLYTGWAGEVNGDHARLMMNATLWLAGITNDSTGSTTAVAPITRRPTLGIYPNPASEDFEVIAPEPLLAVTLTDLRGRILQTLHPGAHPALLAGTGLQPGVYTITAHGCSGAVYHGRVLRIR